MFTICHLLPSGVKKKPKQLREESKLGVGGSQRDRESPLPAKALCPQPPAPRKALVISSYLTGICGINE